MTLKNGKRAVVTDTLKVGPKGPGPENQFIQLRPALHGREADVLKAVTALPAEIRTPSAAATELVRRGIGIPYSTLGSILRRLERKGALRMGRVKS
jgi:hypothetical protein